MERGRRGEYEFTDIAFKKLKKSKNSPKEG